MITPYLYVPLLAWVIAQGIKVSIEIIKGDADFKYLYASGGMPSAHSAVVCSLAGYTFYHQGISSPLFGVTAILAGIVMYDSFGVRRSSGEQAKTINRLIEEMTNNGTLRKPDDYNRLREILGHQPLEVIVGAILGGLVATLFSLNQLDPIIKWLTSTASTFEIYAIYSLGASMVALTAIAYISRRKKLKRNKNTLQLSRYLLCVNILFGLLIMLAGLLAKESITVYGQRWLVCTILSVWLIAVLIIAWRWLNVGRVARFDSENINYRKNAWLKKAGKKR